MLPDAKLRQGENGCASEWFDRFAMRNHPWSEVSQAKWDLRRMTGWVYELPADLQIVHSCGIDFAEIPVYDSPCLLTERSALEIR